MKSTTMTINEEVVKELGDVLVTETQYGVVKCGSACIKIIYELCKGVQLAAKHPQQDISEIINLSQEKSPTQQSCDLAGCNLGTKLARICVSSSVYRSLFGAYEFGLTLSGITRGVSKILGPLGYTGRMEQGSSLQDIKNSIASGFPCIVLYLEGVSNNPWSKNKIVDGRVRNPLHYSIVYHISDTEVYIRDPNNTHSKTMPIDEFEKRRSLDTYYLNDRRAKRLYRLGFVTGNSVVFVDKM